MANLCVHADVQGQAGEANVGVACTIRYSNKAGHIVINPAGRGKAGDPKYNALESA